MADSIQKTAVANYIGAAIWNQIRLSIGDVEVYNSTYNAYKNYISSVLSYDNDYKEGVLSAGGFVVDDDGLPLQSDNSISLKKRQKLFNGDSIDIYARLHLEPFDTDKLLIPHINMQLSLYRNSDSFIIESPKLGADKLGVEIHDIKLHMRAIEVASSASVALENRLKNSMARYPFTSCQAKVVSIGAGRMEMPYQVLYHDRLPRKIIVALLEPECMDGGITKNCFNFENHNVQEMKIDAAGEIYPSTPLTMDFENKHYARVFTHMFEELGCVSEGKCPRITYNMYRNGFAFHVFSLTPMDTSNTWELVRSGTTQLSIKFAKKTPASGLNCLVLSYFDSQYCIDSYRSVYMS